MGAMTSPGWSQCTQEAPWPSSQPLLRRGEQVRVGFALQEERERMHGGKGTAAAVSFGNCRSVHDMVLAHKEVVTNWGQAKQNKI